MEHFVVSARKYRPQTFKDVVGQQAITNTLENAIKNNHLAQALLFTGPRGVGKTTCARILAKRINEEDLGENNADEDFSFNIFELDAASNNSVEDIRSLTDQVRIPPRIGKYKVYIIDEVHMLSQQAFNAFLKTLEEPPAHAIFILATTEKHKIIPTILSRCQIFDFKRITVKDAKEHLKEIATQEGVNADDDALHVIAQKADGAMRDALSIYDRIISYCGKDLTREAVTQNLNILDYETYFKITDLVLENNIPELLVEFNSILSKGFDAHQFITGLASHFRELLVSKDNSTVQLLEVGDNAKSRYLEQCQKTDLKFLLSSIEIANDCDLKFKASKNPRLLIELALMKIASITFDGEKKNPKQFIIPAKFFGNRIVEEKIDVKTEVTPPSTTSTPKQTDNSKTDNSQADINKKEELAGPRRRGGSSLSIKSLSRKKEEEQEVTTIDYSKMPKDPFTEREIHQLWVTYTKELFAKGNNDIGSIVNSDKPKIDGFNLKVTMPSKNMAKKLQTHKPELLNYLRKNTNNYSIELLIDINETVQKEFVYTNKEKFEKLAQKNPYLNTFKQRFDLDM